MSSIYSGTPRKPIAKRQIIQDDMGNSYDPNTGTLTTAKPKSSATGTTASYTPPATAATTKSTQAALAAMPAATAYTAPAATQPTGSQPAGSGYSAPSRATQPAAAYTALKQPATTGIAQPQAGYTPPQSTNVGAGQDRPANNKFGITAQPRKSASDILGNAGQSGTAVSGYTPTKSAVSGQSAVTGLAPIRDTRTANLSPIRNTRTVSPAPAQSPRADTPAANIRFNTGFAQQNFVNPLANPAKSGILKQETVDDYQSASAAARAAYLMPLQSPAAVEDDAGNSNRDDQPARLQEEQAYIKQKRIDAMTDKAAVQSQWDAMKQQAQTYAGMVPDRKNLDLKRLTTKEIEENAKTVVEMSIAMKNRSKDSWNDLRAVLRNRPDMYEAILKGASYEAWIRHELKRQTAIQQGYLEDGMLSQKLSITPVEHSNISVMFLPARNDAAGTQDSSGYYFSEFQSKDVPAYDTDWVPIFSPGEIETCTVGNRSYSSHTLSLSPELQRATYEMCKIAGVDYFFVLALIAHESGSVADVVGEPTTLEGVTHTAYGMMQMLDTLWWAYNADADDDEGKTGTNYSQHQVVKDLQAYAKQFDPSASFTQNVEDLHHPVTAISMGIAACHEHQRELEAKWDYGDKRWEDPMFYVAA